MSFSACSIYMDNLVEHEQAAGSKRWLPLLRDSVAFKLCYACGLRRQEPSMLETVDFGPNPDIPDYGMFGALAVRWGKGTAAYGPRRRTVLTVPQFEWVVPMVEKWITPSRRGRFPTADRSLALWPSERSSRVAIGTFGDSWAAAREAVGLPDELGLHCLRHSYITHLLESGYDPLLAQQQVGHAYASTTGLYTHVSDAFKQRSIHKMTVKRARLEKEAVNG